MGEDRFVERILERVETLPVVKPGIDAVIEAIKKLYDLNDAALVSPSQARRLSEARSLAAWAVQELTDAPLTELAARVGRESSLLSDPISHQRVGVRSSFGAWKPVHICVYLVEAF